MLSLHHFSFPFRRTFSLSQKKRNFPNEKKQKQPEEKAKMRPHESPTAIRFVHPAAHLTPAMILQLVLVRTVG